MLSLTTERLKDSGDRRGTGICFGEEPKWLLLCNDLGIFQGLVFRYCWITGNHNWRVEGTEDCSKKDRVLSATGSVTSLNSYAQWLSQSHLWKAAGMWFSSAQSLATLQGSQVSLTSGDGEGGMPPSLHLTGLKLKPGSLCGRKLTAGYTMGKWLSICSWLNCYISVSSQNKVPKYSLRVIILQNNTK